MKMYASKINQSTKKHPENTDASKREKLFFLCVYINIKADL